MLNKKIISIIMAVLVVLSSSFISIYAFADNSKTKATASLTDSKDTLKKQFTDAKSKSGINYCYYNPTTGLNDDTKYPLVIYIHGLFHGWTNNSYKDSGLLYWSTYEMQSRFLEGGAHLIMPRIPELTIIGNKPGKIKALIDEYIAANKKNVDTDQILIMGGSAGGGVAWKMIIENPDFYASAVILCATKTPTAAEIKKCANLPIWLISNKTDPLINFAVNQTPTWNKITQYSKVKEKCRWMVFGGRTYLPDGSSPLISHFLAKTISYDLYMFDDGEPLPGNYVIDANGKSVSLAEDNEGIIAWLQENTGAKNKFVQDIAEEIINALPVEQDVVAEIPETTEVPQQVETTESENKEDKETKTETKDEFIEKVSVVNLTD